MNEKHNVVVAACVLAWMVPANVSIASGLLVGAGGSRAAKIRSLRVLVEMKEMIAATTVQQVFENPTGRPLEAVYVFPLPPGASVASFSMWVNGVEMRGEMMERRAARRHYDQITNRWLDPALLEHVKDDTFKISVSPVPARGRVKVKLVYTQTLRYRKGVIQYTFPLRTRRSAPARVEGDFTLTVRAEASAPLLHVYSPTHTVDVTRDGRRVTLVGFEQTKAVLDRDFSLVVSLARERSGVTILTYRHSKSEDGYFLALVAAAQTDAALRRIPKDVLFVCDTSGSMAGAKMAQARKALRYCIKQLPDGDRFNVVRFSTGVARLATGLLPANAANRREALDFVDTLKAAGGTNIAGALNAALSYKTDPERPAQILFLTDGVPTVGQTEVDPIVGLLTARRAVAKRLPRVFVFGVGSDVNTKLLDKMAEVTGASRSYVEPDERIDDEVSELFDRISSPVLDALALTTPGLNSYDVFPSKLPPLYAGRQLVVTGRYRTGGAGAVKVVGRSTTGTVTLIEERTFPRGAARSADFIPRLWAMRKVGALLDAIRLNGEHEELVTSVVALSKKHNVMTPYTSSLVLESERMYAERGIRRPRRDADGVARERAPGLAHRSSPPRRSARSGADAPDDRGDTVFAHEAVEVQDHMETENNMDFNIARGQEDAISDVPLGGTGIVGNIGIGGGGAGCFGFRTGGGRRRAALRGGGSRASEAAVDAALNWLAREQSADGGWRVTSRDAGIEEARVALTGLGCLAFLGAGHTEKTGRHKEVVRRAIRFLVSRQAESGEIGSNTDPAVGGGRNHAIAGLALAEAYGMARVPDTGRAAQLAVEWSMSQVDETLGGWSVTHGARSDTVLTAWFVAQLKSAVAGGLRVDGKGFQRAIQHLDAVTAYSDGQFGRVSSKRGEAPTRPATAAGLLCRQFMGWREGDPVLTGAADFIVEELPDWQSATADGLEYRYFGTLAMFQIGGDWWKAWNASMRDALLTEQAHDAAGTGLDGSWSHVADGFGRAWDTAVAALCLEVYYRYLPLYKGGMRSMPERPSGREPPRATVDPMPGIGIGPVPETGEEAVRRSEQIRRLRDADTLGGAE